MSSNMWVSLHTHTQYSLYDGVSSIEGLVKQAKKFGMPAISITDHGNIGGAIKFYKECKKHDIKPIIGCEMYICYDAKLRGTQGNNYNHLLVLAKNEIGYKNLKKLTTLSNEPEYFYRKPRIDFNMLDRYGDGLIISSACLKGEIAESIVKGGGEGYDMAKAAANKYRERFKDDYYLELMFHGNNAKSENSKKPDSLKSLQAVVFAQTLRLAKELSIPTIVTNDSHYDCKQDDYTQRIKMHCQQHRAQNTETDGGDEGYGKNTQCANEYNEFYLKSPEEMYNEFSVVRPSLEQTIEIANKCDIYIPLGKNAKICLPNFDIPQTEEYLRFKSTFNNSDNLDENAIYLHYKSFKGLVDRGLGSSEQHIERLKYELAVITKTEYAKYFLIVADYIAYAWSIGVAVGAGRGSAAGSLMCYCLGITDLDPIEYGMSFERFLASEMIYTMDERDFS